MLVKDPPYPEPCRRLSYAGTALVPAGKGHWLVPGKGAVPEDELFRDAKRQGVFCCLFERYAIGELRYEY